MDNLNEASLNQLNIYEEESRKRIYTIVDDYSNSMKLNLSNIQKLRLSNMLSEDFINGYKSLRNTNEFPSFTDSMIRIKIKNRLGNENKLYNRQNNVINLNIIHKFINDINSLKHDDVDKLAKILNNISTSKLKKEEIQDFKDNMHSYINDKKLSPTDILNSNAGKILNQIFYHENYETLFTDTVIADDTALTIINGILSGTERDDKRIKKLNIKLFKYIKKEVLSDEIKKDFRKNYKKDENLEQVDQVMNILTQIVNGENYDKIFTKEFLANTNNIKEVSKLNKLSFCSENNEKKNIESINKFYGREEYNINSSDGYIKDISLALNIYTGTVFRDPSFNGNIYIPQANDINLGSFILGYKMNGYQYKNPINDKAEIDKINKNGYGKYILGRDDINYANTDVLDHIINVMSDDQKNTNLPNQLSELNNYLTYNGQINFGDKSIQDFEHENHWVNDILQYNLVDIFNNAYENKSKSSGMLKYFSKIKNGDSISNSVLRNLSKSIVDNYIVQYHYIKDKYENADNEFDKKKYKDVLYNYLNKGFKLDEFKVDNNLDLSFYNELEQHVFLTLRNNNINEINKLTSNGILIFYGS